MGRQEEATLNEVVAMDATTKALEVVAHGGVEAVMTEKEVQGQVKIECEVQLQTSPLPR